MKVRHLKTILNVMPDDAEVFQHWDGKPRSRIEWVWVTKDGRVIVSDAEELIEPEHAPRQSLSTERLITPTSGSGIFLGGKGEETP